MSIKDDFMALIAEWPVLQDMCNNFMEKPYGVSYLFDGYMACHIVFANGRYYDVQDTLCPLDDLHRFSHYDSVLSLVLQFERSMSQ